MPYILPAIIVWSENKILFTLNRCNSTLPGVSGTDDLITLWVSPNHGHGISNYVTLACFPHFAPRLSSNQQAVFRKNDELVLAMK